MSIKKLSIKKIKMIKGGNITGANCCPTRAYQALHTGVGTGTYKYGMCRLTFFCVKLSSVDKYIHKFLNESVQTFQPIEASDGSWICEIFSNARPQGR